MRSRKRDRRSPKDTFPTGPNSCTSGTGLHFNKSKFQTGQKTAKIELKSRMSQSEMFWVFVKFHNLASSAKTSLTETTVQVNIKCVLSVYGMGCSKESRLNPCLAPSRVTAVPLLQGYKLAKGGRKDNSACSSGHDPPGRPTSSTPQQCKAALPSSQDPVLL